MFLRSLAKGPNLELELTLRMQQCIPTPSTSLCDLFKKRHRLLQRQDSAAAAAVGRCCWQRVHYILMLFQMLISFSTSFFLVINSYVYFKETQIAYCFILHLMHDSKSHLMEQNCRKGCTLCKHHLIAENSNLFISKCCSTS